MKTITLKADATFDARLTRLAGELGMTKSAVIRAAVVSYERQIEREALARQVRDASLKTRYQAQAAADDLSAVDADGLDS